LAILLDLDESPHPFQGFLIVPQNWMCEAKTLLQTAGAYLVKQESHPRGNLQDRSLLEGRNAFAGVVKSQFERLFTAKLLPRSSQKAMRPRAPESGHVAGNQMGSRSLISGS
jgi:hypothetical protein